MLKNTLLKTSSFLYRAHYKAYTLVNRYLQDDANNKDFIPYRVKNSFSSSKVKIIHVNGNFSIGGSTQLIIDIIENLSDLYAHEVIVPKIPQPLPYQPVAIREYSVSELQQLRDYLEKERPAAVHIHYWVRMTDLYLETAIWYATIFRICEELGIKVFQNVNVPTKPFPSTSVVHNIFVSKFVSDNFSSDSETPASVIYPGSNFEHFKNDNIGDLPINNIGMVYRLDTDKLNAEAIEVFISVVKKQSNIQCYIIGAGYYFEYYNKRVAEEGLEKNFIFTGVVSYNALPEYYKKMSVFVAPVHDESFGQVTPFAMSMGLGVAGYNTGALSEILGSTKYLVEYGRIESLADVIIDLVNDRRVLLEQGFENQKRAHANFSVESMVNQYRELYATHIHIEHII